MTFEKNLSDPPKPAFMRRDTPTSEFSEITLTPIQSLEKLISRVGFGSFQKRLLVLCGFGWLADNMWMQCISVILPRVQQHFNISDELSGVPSSAIYVGMAVGAFFFGMFSDAYGRKLAFNITFCLSSVFGIIAAFSPNFLFLCIFLVLLGCFVGGNVPCDSALFIEFIPKEKQYFLTLLSAFCSVGAIIASGSAWAIIPRFSCDPHVKSCDVTRDNNGWRYTVGLMAILNSLMFLARIFLIKMEESPRFLIAKGKREEALKVFQNIIRVNGDEHKIQLTIDDIPKNLSLRDDVHVKDEEDFDKKYLDGYYQSEKSSIKEMIGNFLFPKMIRPLFTKTWIRTTLLVWFIWILISLAYTIFSTFLPKFLELRGVGGDSSSASMSSIYRDYFIFSFFSLPGPFIGSYFAETRLGRKGIMTIGAIGTAASMIMFTLVYSNLGMVLASALINLFSITIYSVLYAYTPEVFESKVRGTACGIASSLSRVAAILAPVLTGVLLSTSLSLPLWISSGSFTLIVLAIILLPIETRGRQAM